MGSTRLPGKVLVDLGGRTVLSHVLERCKMIAGVDEVCCAVPDTADSDSVADEAERCRVTVSRGSEHDVLGRYYRAAKNLRADIVLRVTSDCPMIDPAVCARVMELRAREDATYAGNNMPPSWPHGLDCEAFPFSWLERAAREAAEPRQREHAGPFIRDHAEARLANLASPDAGMARHRWTLDTPADLEFMRTLWPHIPQGPTGWDYRVPLAILERTPEISAINAGHVERARVGNA